MASASAVMEGFRKRERHIVLSQPQALGQISDFWLCFDTNPCKRDLVTRKKLTHEKCVTRLVRTNHPESLKS